MSKGKIVAYGMAALLIAILVGAGLSAASFRAPGPAPASFLGGCGVCGSFSLGSFVPVPGSLGFGGTGWGGIASGPGIAGFDTWGWGGLGPGGIVGPGACGYDRHGKGFLWSPWNPGLFF